MASFNSDQERISVPKLHHGSDTNSSAPGHVASKVIYKRRRVSSQMPITILETSSQEFRGAVQKLTGFHRATITPPRKTSELKIPSCGEETHLRHVDYDGDDGDSVVDPQEQNLPHSMLSGQTSELLDVEFFKQYSRSNRNLRRLNNHDNCGKFDTSAPIARGAWFPPFPNSHESMKAAYPPPLVSNGLLVGHPSRTTRPPLWDEIDTDFLSSLAELQDPSLPPNPYLIALEQHLLAKMAKRMRFAASNSVDHRHPIDEGLT
uniref:VQ domain-containing protein n=1 Tax=Physcomitrium patens TaxID=3218 RepID=A9T1P4_PHYPA|nr:hypothetical protein PHYPA_024545 [Physcomitrium patens]